MIRVCDAVVTSASAGRESNLVLVIAERSDGFYELNIILATYDATRAKCKNPLHVRYLQLQIAANVLLEVSLNNK